MLAMTPICFLTSLSIDLGWIKVCRSSQRHMFNPNPVVQAAGSGHGVIKMYNMILNVSEWPELLVGYKNLTQHHFNK